MNYPQFNRDRLDDLALAAPAMKEHRNVSSAFSQALKEYAAGTVNIRIAKNTRDAKTGITVQQSVEVPFALSELIFKAIKDVAYTEGGTRFMPEDFTATQWAEYTDSIKNEFTRRVEIRAERDEDGKFTNVEEYDPRAGKWERVDEIIYELGGQYRISPNTISNQN